MGVEIEINILVGQVNGSFLVGKLKKEKLLEVRQKLLVDKTLKI